MTHLSMSLTVIFLLLSGLASQVTATNETLCEALRQHDYPKMGLLSLTWYTFAYQLYIFTQPGYRYYDLPYGKITYASIDLSQSSPTDMAENAGYTEAFAPVKGQTHRGTYVFTLSHFWTTSLDSYKWVFLIVTDRGTRTGSYTSKLSYAFTDVTVHGTALPDFTLAGMAYDASKDLSGYVLSADADRFPGFIILSQYKVFWEGSKVTGLPLPAGQTDDRPFFFLQVMDHPFEVFLVHSSNQPDPEAQLLRSVPRSFLYDKKHLVLLDTVNGCVHIIQDFAGFNVDDTKSRTFKRSNYPFEVYFKCGKPLDNPKPNRCNVVRGSHRPTVTTPQSPDTTESVVSFSMGRTVSVCLLVVAVLAVALIYAIMSKKKGKGGTKGRSAGKWSASTSTISGTSKRGSKSKTGSKLTVANSAISGHGVKSKSTSKVAKNRQASKTSTSK